jgi:hypothetical protein
MIFDVYCKGLYSFSCLFVLNVFFVGHPAEAYLYSDSVCSQRRRECNFSCRVFLYTLRISLLHCSVHHFAHTFILFAILYTIVSFMHTVCASTVRVACTLYIVLQVL